MVKIINGMKASEHLGETIECPLCGEKLISMQRHWCGARLNNYKECKLRKKNTYDENVSSEYRND